MESAQTMCADKDSPAMQAAARAALTRAKVVDIVDAASGIQGVLKELGAKVIAHEVKIEIVWYVAFH